VGGIACVGVLPDLTKTRYPALTPLTRANLPQQICTQVGLCPRFLPVDGQSGSYCGIRDSENGGHLSLVHDETLLPGKSRSFRAVHASNRKGNSIKVLANPSSRLPIA